MTGFFLTLPYLVDTILAVHLTVEEGLKLKIAMKGGLEKFKQIYCLLLIFTFAYFHFISFASWHLSSPVTLFPPTTLSSPENTKDQQSFDALNHV